ncbi:MAG: hypothetical protein LBD01_02810 [Puniceicoccales bacterium]|jgi:DNA-binding transcriptional regulator/RsmH inhibitor MraZ|nr:hypothetical protein [Puniceicoccales bacterium]
MASTSRAKLFVDNFPGKLDDQNRLTIPADWRFEAEGENVYLATFFPPSGGIMVLPPDIVEKVRDAARNTPLSNYAAKAALRQISSSGTLVSCDKAGRIKLKESMLREAGITKEVTFLGEVNSFLISSPTPPEPDVSSPRATAFIEALKTIGL